MYGMIFSMKSFTQRMSPTDQYPLSINILSAAYFLDSTFTFCKRTHLCVYVELVNSYGWDIVYYIFTVF